MVTILSPDTITSSTLTYYNRKLRDEYFTSTPFTEFLLNAGIKPVEGGLQYSQPIMYTLSSQADVWGGGIQQLTANFIPNTTLATWSPVYYYGAIGIPDTTAILNQGQAQIVDIVEAQYEQMLMSLIERFSIDAYSDGTPRNGFLVPQGLRAIATSGSDPGGGAYGGISRSGSSGYWNAPVGAAPWWNANVIPINNGPTTVWSKASVNPGTSTTMSYNALFALLISATVGMYRPLAVFCDAIAYQAVGNLMVAIGRESTLESVFKQGARGFAFGDMPFFQDDKAPSGSLFTVNDLLELRVWKNALFAETPWRQPSNAMVNIKYLLLICALVHSRPNTQTYMNGITG
jgi:hypothetical protein